MASSRRDPLAHDPFARRTTKWSEVRRRLDPAAQLRVDEARAWLAEITDLRPAVVDVLAIALQAAQEYLFDDVTRKPIERRPQAELLLEVLEDLDAGTRAVLARYLTEITKP